MQEIFMSAPYPIAREPPLDCYSSDDFLLFDQEEAFRELCETFNFKPDDDVIEAAEVSRYV